MILKFTIISDEIDEFIRIIEIDSEATFFDFHQAILDAVDYEKNEMTSFFLCNDDWEKEQEITLIEMESSSEYDSYVMEDTVLDELLTDEKQKLLYVFDMISDRAFFIELSEMIPGKDLDDAQCTFSKGKAPLQISIDNDLKIPTDTLAQHAHIDDDNDFFGDDSFDIDELDSEGFGDLNFDEEKL